jgi:RNA methyltransferase, TrmH family
MPIEKLISSPHNPFFRYCLSLRESRKRRQHQAFLVDGLVEIQRAAHHDWAIETILLGDQFDLPEIDQLAAEYKIDVQRFTNKLFDRLIYGQSDKQPIAVAKQRMLALNSLALCSDSHVLVLDQTEKPGNLGACLRTAAACQISAVVLTNPICDLFNPNAIRSSRGAIFELPIAICTSEQFLSAAREFKLPIYAARVDSGCSLWDLELKSGTAVVFGNETHGLGSDWTGSQVQSFTIPMPGSPDSLNLSISAAVTLYEGLRQRFS